MRYKLLLMLKNYFKVESKNSIGRTSYKEFKFSRFTKLIRALIPGIFKEQSYQYIKDFKTFADEGKCIDN